MSRLICLFAATAVVCAVSGFAETQPPKETASRSKGSEARPDTAPVTVDEARRQAVLLHDTYLSALLVVHREYFDEKQRDTLPARAFEDIFKEIDAKTKGRTRWISVNAPAMNIDHEPKPGFEQEAAKALSDGAPDFERTEDKTYHRAAPVRFGASCTKCHLSALGNRRDGRMAGLVISLPLRSR